jgi:DNA-binding winged helix-turn-helix (wHTH) protein/TolB-like protein/Flp pilus assembly protein TadD
VKENGLDARFYEFDAFRVDVAKRQLFRDGEATPLKPKTFDTLLVLLQNAGHVVSKDQLMDALWPDVAVEEANLTQHISLLRKALGDSSANRYIVTHSGRGYEFVGDVCTVGESASITKDSTYAELPESDENVRNWSDEYSQPQLARSNKRWAVAVLISGLAIFGIGSVVYVKRFVHPKSDAATMAIKQIAILPFKPLEANREADYMGRGLADALVTKLSDVGQINVRPTSAVLKYSAVQDPLIAGRELKVDAILDGRVQRLDDHIRVTVQLLRVADGKPLWADSFNEKFGNVFSLEDEIATEVAQALTLKLTGSEQQRITKRLTNNTEAYQLALQAGYLWTTRTAASLLQCRQYYEKAIELDPKFALAYAGLAISYTETSGAMTPKESYGKMKEYAQRAVELDENLTDGHAALGFAQWRLDYDWRGAEKQFQRAIELDPHYLRARAWYALLLQFEGRFDESLAQLQKAQEFGSPLTVAESLGEHYYLARDYDKAIEYFQQALLLRPDYQPGLLNQGQSYSMKKQYALAIPLIKKAVGREELTSENNLAALGYAYAGAGRSSDALRIVQKLVSMQNKKPPQSGSFEGALAMIYAGLGDKDRALAHLQKSIEKHEWWAVEMKVAPHLDSLRTEQRFVNLLEPVGLAR